MSCFLGGVVHCEGSSQDRLAWRMLEEGSRCRVHLLFGCNVNPLMKDIIEENLDDSSECQMFQFTESPAMNVSDDLVDDWPICESGDLTQEESEVYMRQVKEYVLHNADRIASVLSTVLKDENVRGLELWVSEGYDDSYRDIPIVIDEFVDAYHEAFRSIGYFDIPSTHFVIRKNG